MTVQELINKLEKIENKQQGVFVWAGGHNGQYIVSNFELKQEEDETGKFLLLEK